MTKKRVIKEVNNKFNIGQRVISNNGVPAIVVSIFLTPESASNNGKKVAEPLLYQVRDEEGNDLGVDRTVIEKAIFLTEKEYKKARIKELRKELKELEV